MIILYDNNTFKRVPSLKRMKKLVSLFVLSLMIITMLGVVSAVCTGNTIVGGTIYQDVVTNGVVGATVQVICSHSGTNYTQNVLSIADGQYSAEFQCGQCDYGDLVTVNAQKNTLTGTNDGSVSMNYNLPGITLNVGIVNVPLVPEFGLIAGITTVLGALGMFFFLRRK